MPELFVDSELWCVKEEWESKIEECLIAIRCGRGKLQELLSFVRVDHTATWSDLRY